MEIPDDPGNDWAYRLLSNARRRFVLAYLDGGEPPVSVETLATQLALWERDRGDAPSPDDYRAVETSLHHVHLPMLADAGVVDYDFGDGAVTAWRHPWLGGEWVTDADPTVLADRLAG